jgi:TetR/AcrR family transcriptional regulator
MHAVPWPSLQPDRAEDLMPRIGDTRTKILEVAEAEFASEGYAGAHLQKIAEQVGVRKTALYYYFASKAELYTDVLGTILEAFDHCIATALESSGSPEGQLEELVARVNDLLAERPNYARILLRVFVDHGPSEMETVLPTVRRMGDRVLQFFQRGIDEGAFRPLSSRHILQSVFGMMIFHYAAPYYSARMVGVDDVFTRPVVAWRRDEVISLLRDGMRARPDDAKP